MNVKISFYLTTILFSQLVFSQNGIPEHHDDTITGRLQIAYNNPRILKYSILPTVGFDLSSVAGAQPLPIAGADFHLRPINNIMLHANGTLGAFFIPDFEDFFGQKVKNIYTTEFGARLYFTTKTIEKVKSFIAGNNGFNYEMNFPVKVRWNTGIVAAIKTGKYVFQTGSDSSQTQTRFAEQNSGKYFFFDQTLIPYTFQEISAGFCLTTNTRTKFFMLLPPNNKKKARRMKTLTEFRIEFVYAPILTIDNTIIKREFSTFPYKIYDVKNIEKSRTGAKLSGFFRRRVSGFKFEAGIKPGMKFKFSTGESNWFNRSYLLFSYGLGWM